MASLTLSEIDAKITSLTGFDTGAYPIADRVTDYNIWMSKVVGIILNSQDETDFDDPNHGNYPIISDVLVANQRDYSIPVSEDILEFKDVQVTYDGTNWVKAYPIDRSSLSDNVGNDALLDSQFSKSEPRYDTEGLSLFIYPMAIDSLGSFEVRTSRGPKKITTTDWTTGTYIPGIDSTFHDILAYGPSYEVAHPKGLKNLKNIKDGLDESMALLIRQYGRKNKDRNLRLQAECINYN